MEDLHSPDQPVSIFLVSILKKKKDSATGWDEDVAEDLPADALLPILGNYSGS